MTKNYKKYQGMTQKELNDSLRDMKREMMKIKSQIATKTIPEKPSKLKQLRRNVARILTFKKTKEVENKA